MNFVFDLSLVIFGLVLITMLGTGLNFDFSSSVRIGIWNFGSWFLFR